MNKQTTPSALTEEVSKNNDPKQVKAKQIFLGIDAHLARNQVARKKDNSGIQGVQSLSFEELLLLAQKQLSLAEEVYAVWSVFDLADRCKLDLKPWKRTIRNQGVNLAGALTKSLSVMRLGCWSSGFGRPSSWPENWECRAGA
jgi:hypothetical protein